MMIIKNNNWMSHIYSDHDRKRNQQRSPLRYHNNNT